MKNIFAFGLFFLLCQMAFCSAVTGDTVPKVVASDGITFPVRKVDVQGMYDFRGGRLIASIEAYRRVDHHAFVVEINADNPFQQSRVLGLYSKVGYTYFAKPKMGGWGLYVGWDGGRYPPERWGNVWNYYLFGAEYELFRPSGRLYHFRLMNCIYDGGYGFFPGGWFPAMFSFDWDVPRLFGVKGLSFCGKFDLWYGEFVWVLDDDPYQDYLGFGLPFRLEPQLWYNIGALLGGHNGNTLFDREGLGVFLKLRINYNNPGGWHSGGTYEKNANLNLTYCLGVRMDL